MTKLIEKTNGKKTELTSLLMVAFQVLMTYNPDLVSPQTERAINITISSGVLGALIHRLYRNRKKISNFVINNFKKLTSWLKKV